MALASKKLKKLICVTHNCDTKIGDLILLIKNCKAIPGILVIADNNVQINIPNEGPITENMNVNDVSFIIYILELCLKVQTHLFIM